MKEVFSFLNDLSGNNNRDWFQENKPVYEKAKQEAQQVFEQIHQQITALDEVGPAKMYRIYNDVRFAKGKPLYKEHFGAIIPRVQPYNRGSFYMHLQPNNQSFVGGGFFAPNADDLLNIRKAIVYEDEIVNITQNKNFIKTFGSIQGDGVKVAPKGFDKEHPRIEFIRLKQWLLMHSFTDEEVMDKNFAQKVAAVYQDAMPFFQYMTQILITDGNGELKIK